MERKLNRNCKLKVIVERAEFKKDADTFGKQDPFVVIECSSYKYQTKVIDEGGKKPVWNEEFMLREIINEVEKGSFLCIQTFDYDGLTSDFLGWSNTL
jgi:Ca2+-dependent lipid-binding protein